MKKPVPNMFLKGHASVRHSDGFQYGDVGHTTSVVKRRFTENMKSHYTKFDDQTDYVLVKPLNPIALKLFLNDLKGVAIGSEEIIRLILEKIE